MNVSLKRVSHGCECLAKEGPTLTEHLASDDWLGHSWKCNKCSDDGQLELSINPDRIVLAYLPRVKKADNCIA